MKPLIAIIGLSALLVLHSCDEKKDTRVNSDIVTNSKSAEGEKDVPVSAIKFEEELFNFGEVLEGEKVTHAYKFKNTGNNDLIINNASGSCGCTVPEWPKDPIKPGETGIINVVFNSENRAGNAEKSVTIFANTEPSKTVIRLKGFVKENSKDKKNP